MSAYSEQIVYTPSEDQRLLAGVLMQPTGAAVRSLGMVMLHGSTVAFYYPLMYVYLGRALAERGYRYLSGNTRSHDIASPEWLWPPTCRGEDVATWRLGGHGWTRFDEEPHDVAGWIDFLSAQGAEQIVLFGHSGGVSKVLYYQAERQDPRVVGLILAGAADRVQPIDPARLALAQRLVAEGQGDALLPVPEGELIHDGGMESAARVVHWARIMSPFAAEGHKPWIGTIRVPVLATLGAEEVEALPNYEDMRRRAVQAPRFDIQVIQGADHCYTGRERELAEVVLGWLETLPT